MQPHKSMMQIRRLTLAIALSTGLTCSVDVVAESLGSRLTILSAEVAPEQAPPEEAAQHLHELLALGAANPTEFAYPWIDPATGEAVADITSDMGAQLARAFQPDTKSTGAPYRVRTVRHSWSEFDRIRDDIVQLTTKKRDADLTAIAAMDPDPQNNRLIITVDRLSKGLLDTLAARYGTDAIAIRFDPAYPRATAQARQNDDTPFWGGANINYGACTNAFAWSWYDTAQRYGMLTAGHCMPYGGTVYTPVTNQGYVTQHSRENWDPGHGVAWLTGQTVNRADMALIQLDSYRAVQPWIYRGSRTSGTGAVVHEMWNREAAVGDQYCTGGQVTGELCGWRVTRVRFDQPLYATDGTFEGWARNTNQGTKSGACTQQGDSGGPVYTVRTDGRIAAKGIHSWGGGSCVEGFTDIWQPFYGFPGTLLTQ